MAGDEAHISRTEFDVLKADVNQMKTVMERLAAAVERMDTTGDRNRVDGRQRREPTPYEDSDSEEDHYAPPRRGGYRRDRRRRDNYDVGGFKMKMDLPSFNGQMHIEEFLDWIAEVERFFEYMEIPEERKVKLVAYRLKGGASAWWESVCLNRSRQGKPKVDRWEKMKKLLRARFLPSDYEQVLFGQYQNCRQGGRTVNEYTQEFYRLSSRNNLHESEAQQMSRYIGGLRIAIQDRVSLQQTYTLADTVSLAEKVERQLGRNSKGSWAASDGSRTNFNRATTEKGKGPATTAAKKPTPANPYAKPDPIKCYRCGQPGHRSNQCPKRGTVNMVDHEDEDADRDDDEDYDGGLDADDDGEQLSCVVRRLLLAPKAEEPPQRHNIFRTRCTVQQKICDVIIDSGSSENIVSRRMVEKLGLKTEKHPAPYKIGWIRKGNDVQVDEVCRVSFSIGRTYVDEALCDVVEMDACHMLLGRPWQFDVDATHRGKDNVYIFKKDGRRIVLKSLTEKESSKIKTIKRKELFVTNNDALTENLKQSEEVCDLVVTEKEEHASTEIPHKVQTLDMHEMHDGDMIVKMDDMHDILKVVESDIQHINVVPIEEKDKIESETIDGNYPQSYSRGKKEVIDQFFALKFPGRKC
ncbi:uncharacterized protein LOC109835598 [Asparagus officinalis]|uniref:uncharacterized protein LOC109835598 n=1 Tax=Asparagus officinalis TaxID=4686 RepID=UPI00098E2616|nr:uncharacterized protein LOC109835598 [Asparagus officinalis]